MWDTKRDYDHDKSLWSSQPASASPLGGGSPWGSGADSATVQRRATGASVAPPAPEQIVPSGGGQKLDPVVQRKMETSLGADFGDVRIHLDNERAKAMNAEAYTVGGDIVFDSSKYDPHSREGQHTLAHELTHVVQQRSGPVSGSSVGDGVSVSDPSDSFERAAEDAADRAMGGAPMAAQASSGASGAPASAGAVSVQRKKGGGPGGFDDALEDANNVRKMLSQPAGSRERRDAAMDGLRSSLGRIPLIGDWLADKAEAYKNKEEAKLSTVKEGDADDFKVEGQLGGDNATINRNLQGENVGDIDTGNGQIVKPDGTIINKKSEEEEPKAPQPEEKPKEEGEPVA